MPSAPAGLPLLDREHELEQVGRALARVRDGEGALLAIEGPAGIGKTALMRRVREQAGALRVLAAGASELERDFGFGVVRQWVAPLEVPSEGAARLAAPVLDGEGEADVSHGVLHGLYWLLARAAAQEPLLLLLDDAHWADEPSLRFLNFLAPRLEGSGLGVVVGCRPPEGVDELALLARLLGDPRCELVRPQPLGAPAARDLLARELGETPDDAFLEACLAQTDGNPFYLQELGRALAADGVAPQAQATGAVATAQPLSLARAILTRLSPQARALAEALAVLDEPADPSLLAELAGTAADAGAVAELVQAGLVDDARPLAFRHAILRGTVLAGLAAGERSARHTRAAAVLAARGAGPERVAAHLLATEPAGDETTVRALREAAALATGRGAPEVAARLLRRALAEPPAREATADVLLDLGAAEQAANLDGAAEHLRAAIATASDPARRARAVLGLHWARGPENPPTPEDLHEIDRIAEEVRDADRELALRLQTNAIEVLFLLPGGGEEMGRRLEAFAGLAGGTPAECALLALVARHRMDSGRPAADVAQAALRSMANPDALRTLGPDSGWLLHIAVTLTQAEELDAAERFLTAAAELARERGSVAGFGIASGNLARVALRRGDLRRAELDARAGLDTSQGWYRVARTAMLVEALALQGRLDEAREAYDSLGLPEQLPPARPVTPILVTRALLRTELGDRERALADHRDALARIARHNAPNAVGLDARLRLALLVDREEGRAEAEEALARAQRWGTPGTIGAALRVLGLVEGDRGRLEEAVSVLAGSPLRLEHATALVDLGAALRREGARAASREPLREGLELAEACAAGPLAERARRELAASGVRVPREGARHRLTPSEQRIAEMAADGATNPQIAQALFVTTKTVESHLANTYRKLDISSRRELPAALERIARGP